MTPELIHLLLLSIYSTPPSDFLTSFSSTTLMISSLGFRSTRPSHPHFFALTKLLAFSWFVARVPPYWLCQAVICRSFKNLDNLRWAGDTLHLYGDEKRHLLSAYMHVIITPLEFRLLVLLYYKYFEAKPGIDSQVYY